MHKMLERLKVGIVFTAVFFASNNVLSARVFAAEPPTTTPCTAPAYRQFDFWAGDWEVFEVGGSIQVAHARVDIILDGCVLREDYRGSDGHKGQSFTIYDAARGAWHQSWGTNRGELLEIEGTLKDGEIVLRRGLCSGRARSRHVEAAERRCSRDGGHLYGWRRDLETVL